MPGIEPGAFHMQSERATTALHPREMKLVMSKLQALTERSVHRCVFCNLESRYACLLGCNSLKSVKERPNKILLHLRLNLSTPDLCRDSLHFTGTQ